MGLISTTNPITPTRPRDGSMSSSGTTPVINRGPVQVIGLSPLTDCLVSQCKYWDADCCYKIPVFAETGTGDIYDSTKNDQSSFLVSLPSYVTGGTQTVNIYLQKLSGSTWNTVASLSNNTYGTYYNWYSLPIYYYKGYAIEWRKVLDLQGEGCYRIYMSYVASGREGCLTSETFQLLTFTCKKAHGTVRVDAKLFDGSIASIDNDGYRYDLTGILWNDSIRFPALFGYENSDEEKRMLELTDGKMVKMRDELIQKFELNTGLLPKWFHDRFKAYGTMADELRITDYNWNNSDYTIVRKLIVREGGYSPAYKRGSRLTSAKVIFKEGYQNVSRSLC